MIITNYSRGSVKYLLFFLLFLVLYVSSFCDQILMRNGKKMDIDIIAEEKDSVTVIEKDSGILLKIPRSQISEVTYEEEKAKQKELKPVPQIKEGQETPAIIPSPEKEGIAPSEKKEEAPKVQETPSSEIKKEEAPPAPERIETKMLANLKKTKEAILQYTKDTGFFPEDNENWFMALMENPQLAGWKGPYITDKDIFTDAWGSTVYYRINRSPFSDAQYGVLVIIGPNKKYDGGYVDDLKEIITVTKPIVEEITSTPVPIPTPTPSPAPPVATPVPTVTPTVITPPMVPTPTPAPSGEPILREPGMTPQPTTPSPTPQPMPAVER